MSIKIFGYGSLLSEDSLKKTVPSATNITPSLLKNYKRVFDLKALRRICHIHGKPIAVLNIVKSKDHFLNGITFDMDEKDFEALKDREIMYEFVEVNVKNLKTNEMTLALTPVVHKYEPHEFLFESEEQKNYMCLAVNGAKALGEEFFDIFKETTYIENKKLKEIEKINN